MTKTLGKKKKIKTWVTKTGHTLKIKDMTTEHIVNTLRMLKTNAIRSNLEMQRKWDRSFVDLLDYPGSLPVVPASDLFAEYVPLVKELRERKLAKRVIKELISQE